MAASETLYERLRRLAIADPKSARIAFLEAFEANDNELTDLLERLRKPGEGRLRQVIANAVRAHPSKQRLFPELAIWQNTETDEFTRRAIVGAMAESDSSPPRRKDSSAAVLPKEVVDAYRYVSERLRHRLRNTMLSAQYQANRLKSATSTGANPDVQVTLAKMNDALLSMSRELEATDADPQHFQPRSIALGDWLRQMDVRYTTRYSSLNLKLINADGAGVRVLASDYLLETVFWNIWLNAHQAAGATCTITVIFESVSNDLVLKILDSGPGFSKDIKEIAFQAMFSTKTAGRGRGLLEIQEAVERLGGNIRLYEEQPSEYRLQVRLPLEAS